jgi:DNA invertase Pin-like site-specific DNA recombinase
MKQGVLLGLSSSTTEIFSEQLEAALDFVRAGDTLVVTRLCRLPRSTCHLLKITETLSAKGVNLQILDLAVDTGSATGKLLLTTLGAVAKFERQLMLERQREGITKAKAERRYQGRKPTARAKADQVKKLKAEGLGATEIATRLGIGRASVCRALGV